MAGRPVLTTGTMTHLKRHRGEEKEFWHIHQDQRQSRRLLSPHTTPRHKASSCPRAGSVSRPSSPNHRVGPSAGGSPKPASTTDASVWGEGAATTWSQGPRQSPVNNIEPSHFKGYQGSPPRLPKVQQAVSHAKTVHPVYPTEGQAGADEV